MAKKLGGKTISIIGILGGLCSIAATILGGIADERALNDTVEEKVNEQLIAHGLIEADENEDE